VSAVEAVSVRARSLGRWATNCVVLGDLARGRAVIVDPGEGALEAAPALLAGMGLEAEAILLSHGHIDHLWGAPALARLLGVPVHLHPADRWLWDDPGAGFGTSLSALATGLGLVEWGVADVDLVDLTDGARLALAGLDLAVRHTPGHTPGSVTFTLSLPAATPVEVDGTTVEHAGPLLVAGDLLFAGSIGRTDLPGGSPPDMTTSLAATLAEHDDATLVVPGHGPMTTIGRERRSNPHLVGLARRDA
jgi:glyoxylase-like metal-dependent hydrolase (beta-lactamase superfamily II)